MSAEAKCARCGDRAESINNETGTTSWSFIQNEVTTTTARTVRVFGTSYRYKPHQLLVTDEKQALCVDCWGLFVGRFMQGRAVGGQAPQDDKCQKCHHPVSAHMAAPLGCYCRCWPAVTEGQAHQHDYDDAFICRSCGHDGCEMGQA
jgi:hypothetical protein